MSETVDPRRRSELRALLQAIEEAGWEYARVEIDGVALTVASDPSLVLELPAAAAPAAVPAVLAAPAPVAPAAPAAPSAPAPVPAPPAADPATPVETVSAPSIGLFWRSPKPGAPPFVEVGDQVAAEDTVCIIEVMKLMTHVPAGVAGVVRTIRVANGDMVEHGTPLVDIEAGATP